MQGKMTRAANGREGEGKETERSRQRVMFQAGWLTAGPASGESRMARGVEGSGKWTRVLWRAATRWGPLSGVT